MVLAGCWVCRWPQLHSHQQHWPLAPSSRAHCSQNIQFPFLKNGGYFFRSNGYSLVSKKQRIFFFFMHHTPLQTVHPVKRFFKDAVYLGNNLPVLPSPWSQPKERRPSFAPSSGTGAQVMTEPSHFFLPAPRRSRAHLRAFAAPVPMD